MEDSELQAIRQARLQELEKNAGGGSSGGNGAGGRGGEEAQERSNQEEEMRLSVLSQILTPQARERLSRIRIVKGDRARGVEDLLIRMARSGQIQQKVSEEQLVQLLDQISQQESKSTQPKILYTKRRSDDEDDEDDFKKPASGAAADDSEDDFFD